MERLITDFSSRWELLPFCREWKRYRKGCWKEVADDVGHVEITYQEVYKRPFLSDTMPQLVAYMRLSYNPNT